MTDTPLPCDRFCPFSACLACPWQGGVNPAAAEADTDAKRDDSRTSVRVDCGGTWNVSPHLLEQAGDVAELDPLTGVRQQ